MHRALVASPARHSHRSRSTHERPDDKRSAETIIPLRPDGLPAPRRARRHAARLFRRSAAGTVGRDAARVDVGQRRRPRDDRSFVAGRPPLHPEIHLGAGGGRLAGARPLTSLRKAPRLAHRLAARPDGGNCLPRHARSHKCAVDDRPGRTHRRFCLGDAGHRRRCLSRAEPARRRAGGGHGGLRRRISHRHARFGRRRHRLQRMARIVRPVERSGVAARLCRRGSAGARRIVRGTRRARAEDGSPRGAARKSDRASLCDRAGCLL